MKIGVRIQLSIMMFLQFFIWGAWFVTMGTYLGQTLKFAGGDIGKAYSAMAWAAIVSPFFVGLIADRFFASQKVLAVMHILGGAALYLISTVKEPGLFFWAVVLHALCYMPTLALTNAVAFRQMDDPGRQFPAIRVLGTIGWIVAGVIIGFLKIEATAMPMQIAAATSVLMGLFCFSLPHTPPEGAGKKISVGDILGLDALRLMKNPSFAIFVLSSLAICIPLAFYYSFANLFLNETGLENAAGKMTLGQASEVLFMIVMPLFFARLGVKWMLVVGMAAWTARYALFAFGNNSTAVWMLYGGIILHGICYDFFFVTGQIYVDKKAPIDLRASAQGFITLVTQGLGMVIGNILAGQIVEKYQVMQGTEITGHNWQTIWLIPAGMATVVLVIFAILFHDRADEPEPLDQKSEPALESAAQA